MAYFMDRTVINSSGTKYWDSRKGQVLDSRLQFPLAIHPYIRLFDGTSRPVGDNRCMLQGYPSALGEQIGTLSSYNEEMSASAPVDCPLGQIVAVLSNEYYIALV